MTIIEKLKSAAEKANDINARFPIGFTSAEIICTTEWISVACRCHIRGGEHGFSKRIIGGHRIVTYEALEYCNSNILIDALDAIEAETLAQVKEYIGA